MKLATLKDDRLVAVVNNQAIPLNRYGFDGSMLDLILAGDDQIKSLSDSVKNENNGESITSKDYDAPLKHPSKIVAIGLNYVDHASESKMELPKHPLVFAKFPSSIISATDPVLIPEKITDQVDYEVELGVIIGKKAKNVKKEDALNYVFGYTVLNDVSARDLQFEDGQWVRAKSLDTFCPLGPVIVTVDEITDPQKLNVGCSVNGETLQNANTKDMIFGVADIISKLSHSFTFEPGDIIATGTPSGVGLGRKPPFYMKPGDVMKTWIEGIGEMINPIEKA